MLSAWRWGAAQTAGNSLAMHVASNRVLVPVYNYDCPKEINSDSRPFILSPTSCLLSLFGGGRIHATLPGKSLHLFVDGKKQKISVDRVTPTDNGVRRDNLGAHRDWADVPRGIWSTSDQEPQRFGGFYLATYFVIAFSPPPSPEGSCHRLRIKDLWYQPYLYYRHEYCNVPHASSDPLYGTPEGARLKRDISSGRTGSIPLSAEASYVYAAPGKARVQVDMEFPFTDIQSRYYLLIIAYKKTGEAVARRSDYYCDAHCITPFNPISVDEPIWRNIAFAPLLAMTRYDMQMELPPGDYRIAVAFSRGSKFGVTEVPLRIRKYDAKRLSISSIALCKRVRKVGRSPVAAKFVPLVSKGYEFTPAADTVFEKGNALMAYFQVYEPSLGGSKRSSDSVKFAMRMINEKTGAVLLHTELSAASYRVPGQSMIPIAVEPELDKLHLKPGPYKLEIQAFDSVGQKTPWQAAAFSYK